MKCKFEELSFCFCWLNRWRTSLSGFGLDSLGTLCDDSGFEEVVTGVIEYDMISHRKIQNSGEAMEAVTRNEHTGTSFYKAEITHLTKIWKIKGGFLK